MSKLNFFKKMAVDKNKSIIFVKQKQEE